MSGSSKAAISATTDAGLFYGAVTLWQLMTADGGHGPDSGFCAAVTFSSFRCLTAASEPNPA